VEADREVWLGAARADIDWDELIARKRPSMMRATIHILRDEHEAEDAVQDACSRAVERFGLLRDPAAAGAWLLRIARNCALNRLRSASRRRRLVTEKADPAPGKADEGPPDVSAPLPEECLIYTEAFSRLAPADRRALDLDLSGLCVREIAAVEGITPGAARQRTFRARQALRIAMLEDDP
jgi:RNA polymerase sigma-70 factor (ECF subfamily)